MALFVGLFWLCKGAWVWRDSQLVVLFWVTAPLRGRAFKHIFLLGLVRRMRETGEICAFRSSNAVKRVREVLEAARNFSGFLRFTVCLARFRRIFC